jgi:sulfatase maturation enzyme AslB (radical SAM superfamily)
MYYYNPTEANNRSEIIMTTSTLNKRIEQVAKATNQTKAEVTAKLFAKDDWTHFLVRQA